MSLPRLTIWGIPGIPEVKPGDDVARLIAEAIAASADIDPDVALKNGDILALDRGGIEGLAAIAIAFGIEIGGDGLDSHGAATLMAMETEPEHHVDDGCLFLVDLQNLLFLSAQDQTRIAPHGRSDAASENN